MRRNGLTILVTITVTILVFAGLGWPSQAQTRSSPHTLKLEKPDSMPAATIQDVSWIAGHWTGEAFGGVSEEIWSPPLGNSMMGMYRLVKKGKAVFYELLTIVEENGSLILKLKHFTSGLVGWEEKDVSIKFPLVKKTPREAFFDGMTFRKLDDGRLQVFLLVSDKKTSEGREEEFLYRPVK